MERERMKGNNEIEERKSGGGMGIQKQKWRTEEEETLKAGVAKYGAGKWKHILTDPEFALFLTHRSNIDLKVHLFLAFFIFLLCYS